MVKHPRRNQSQSSALTIAADNNATDDINTPVSEDKTSEINLLKQVQEQNFIIRIREQTKDLGGKNC